MHRTHRDFVDVVQALTGSADAELAAGSRAFIASAQAHFGEGDRDMAETAFPAVECHSPDGPAPPQAEAACASSVVPSQHLT